MKLFGRKKITIKPTHEVDLQKSLNRSVPECCMPRMENPPKAPLKFPYTASDAKNDTEESIWELTRIMKKIEQTAKTGKSSLSESVGNEDLDKVTESLIKYGYSVETLPSEGYYRNLKISW